jgi:hypothetical protein
MGKTKEYVIDLLAEVRESEAARLAMTDRRQAKPAFGLLRVIPSHGSADDIAALIAATWNDPECVGVTLGANGEVLALKMEPALDGAYTVMRSEIATSGRWHVSPTYEQPTGMPRNRHERRAMAAQMRKR